MITSLGTAICILLAIVNVLAGMLSYLSYDKELNHKERLLTKVPRKLPGYFIGKSLARFKKK